MSDVVCCVAAIRGGALGDFVLTLPALRALRQEHDNAGLCLVSRTTFAPLCQPQQVIDHEGPDLSPLFLPDCPCLPPGLSPLASAPRVLAYAVDSDGVLTANLRRLLQGRAVVHDPRPPAGFLGHITDHLLAPLGEEAIRRCDPEPWIDLTPAERVRAAAWVAATGARAPLVVIHPGSGSPRKNWPRDRFRCLADALRRRGATPLIVLGPSELAAGLSPGTEGGLCLPLVAPRDLAALLAQADLFIGGDSGPGHLAAAVGCPTLSLFGPTDPDLWRPRHRQGRVLRAPGGVLAHLPLEDVTAAALVVLDGAAATRT